MENFAKILQAVTSAYIEALYFTDTGDDEQPPKEAELSRLAWFQATENCACILYHAEQAGLLNEWADAGQTWDYFGHNIWLTQNGHGTGFWDRGLDELGDKLTEICKLHLSEAWVYQGDDGLIYFG